MGTPVGAPTPTVEPTQRSGLLIGLLVGAVVVIIGLATAVFVLANRPEPRPVASAPPATHPTASSTTWSPPVTEAATILATTAPETRPVTVPSTPDTVPPAPPTPPPTVAQPPAVSGVPLDTWAVTLGSLTSSQQAEEHRATLRAVAPEAQILQSAEVASLRSGYWVVYLGGYSSSADAIGKCGSMGFTNRDQCYAAYLSMNPADIDLRVYPD